MTQMGIFRPGYFDRYDDDEPSESESRLPRCKRCGSTDVRWRQQTGRWVLFSLKPGVEHRCEISVDDMPDESED